MRRAPSTSRPGACWLGYPSRCLLPLGGQLPSPRRATTSHGNEEFRSLACSALLTPPMISRRFFARPGQNRQRNPLNSSKPLTPGKMAHRRRIVFLIEPAAPGLTSPGADARPRSRTKTPTDSAADHGSVRTCSLAFGRLRLHSSMIHTIAGRSEHPRSRFFLAVASLCADLENLRGVE
jgi:hypothetical protein